MRLSLCPPCGAAPAGVIENIPAVALLIQLDDGSFEWEGETRVCWDGQSPQSDGQGRALLWCGECDSEYPNATTEEL